MELSLESSWEFFEFTVLKRDGDDALTDAVTVYLYDDDRNIHLSIKGHGVETVQTTIDILKEELVISPFSFEGQEPDLLYFDISGNPSQTNLRNAMLNVIAKLQSLGFKLRKLEDSWV